MSVVSTQGKHIVLDIFDGNRERLDDALFVVQTLEDAARTAGATVLKSDYVKFDGEGVTAFVILAESHTSCHSWPSEHFASFDIFTCGNTKVEDAVPVILERFESKIFSVKTIKRGEKLP